jgi:hypothetical protein
MFVLIRWDRPSGLAVPLSQLEATVADEQTTQAVEDWHYWVEQGYELTLRPVHNASAAHS